MIIGEADVQGQVKGAYELALAARTTGPMTNKLFRAALATGKRVRTETAISAGRASVASVAVDAARAAIGDLDRKSTRLNSSHANISYAVFCLKKKKQRH